MQLPFMGSCIVLYNHSANTYYIIGGKRKETIILVAFKIHANQFIV